MFVDLKLYNDPLQKVPEKSRCRPKLLKIGQDETVYEF